MQTTQKKIAARCDLLTRPVAERYGLDHLAIRTLSDRAGEASSIDFSQFLDRVARQTVAVLRLVLAAIASEV